MAHAKNDPFQKPEVHLPQGAAAIVPIDDVDSVLGAGQPADLFQHDEMSGEASLELIMIFFVQVGIVDIEISGSGLKTLGEAGKKIGDMRTDEIGAVGLDGPSEQLPDHAVELAVADCGPESVF